MLAGRKLLIGVVLALAASATLAADANYPLPDPTHVPIILPNDIKWTGRVGQEQQFKIYGDADKPGPYAMLLKWWPGNFSRPHYHTVQRYITVISGTWWVSSSTVFDPSKTYPLGPGTLAEDNANTVHWDGAKTEPVVLEVTGIGPAPNINVDEKGKPLPPSSGRGGTAPAQR